MATATMSNIDAILKEVYGNRIEEQLNMETVAATRIERTSEGVISTVGGKYVDFPIRIGRNSGTGYRQENEALPNAQQQQYNEVHVGLKYGYGVVQFSKQLMALADKNPQSFASAMDREMEYLKKDLLKDENRVCYGDGTGLLASVTADGANTVTVDNIQYLEIGQNIDIRTRATGATIAADRTISNIAPTTGYAGIVTYSGADATATAADGIYKMNAWVGAVSRERTGFGLIVDSVSVLHTLNPATVPKWAALVRSNASVNRALSEGLMLEASDAVRINGGDLSVFLCNLGVRRAYFNLLTQQRRYTDTKEFAGGFTGLPFMNGKKEIPIVEDPDCPPNRIIGLSESEIKIYRESPWHWADDDGNVLKWVNGFDVFTAYMRCYQEMGTSRRNGHVVIKDITEG